MAWTHVNRNDTGEYEAISDRETLRHAAVPWVQPGRTLGEAEKTILFVAIINTACKARGRNETSLVEIAALRSQ